MTWICAISSSELSPRSLAKMTSSSGALARRTPKLAVLIGRLTKRGKAMTRPRSPGLAIAIVLRLWSADLSKRPIDGNRVLHETKRGEWRNNCRHAQALLSGGEHGHLLLRRKQQVCPSGLGDPHGGVEPGNGSAPKFGTPCIART